MDIAQLIQQYGYVAVALGALLEGETVLILAAAGAHLGFLKLPAVVSVAAVAAFVGDNVYFFAGRFYGPRLMQRFPSLAKAVPRVDRFVGRWHALAVIALRFAYGLRVAGPIVLGAGRMRTLTFVWANALGAVLWSLLLGAIGWGFGHAAARLFGDVARIEHIALGIVIAVVALVGILHFAARRRLSRSAGRGEE